MDKKEEEFGSVYISTKIDAETNYLLSVAAKASRRSKNNELAVRVKEHLKEKPPIQEKF